MNNWADLLQGMIAGDPIERDGTMGNLELLRQMIRDSVDENGWQPYDLLDADDDVDETPLKTEDEKYRHRLGCE
jgi:hypothetical protein